MKRFLQALLRPGDSGLFSRAMSAGFWAAALRIILRASTIVRTVILARLLAPDDFGLMAIATIAILFLERLTGNGIDSALIQREGDIKPFLNTAWTLQIVVGFATAAVLFISAPWLATFFGAPEARLVVQALSIAVALKGFVNIGIVHFVKDLRFDRYFALELTDRGTDIIVSIAAAFMLRNVWALVIGALASAVARLIASYVLEPFRPRLQWTRSQVKELFQFGKWVIASNLLNFSTANIDDILVGRMISVNALGWYRMAYNFSQAVATEITQVTNQVAFPTYAKLQQSADRLRVAYMGSIHFVAFLGFPLAIGTMLVASDLTYGLLGAKWAPIIVPLQLLSISGLIRGVSGTIGPLFQSQGRPDIPPRFSLAKLILLAIMLAPAINRWGINGAAGAVTVAGAITGLTALYVSFRRVGARWQEIRQAILYPAFNTLVMTGAVAGAKATVFTNPTAISFVALTAIGCAAYFASVYLASKIFGYAAPADLLTRIKKAAQ